MKLTDLSYYSHHKNNAVYCFCYLQFIASNSAAQSSFVTSAGLINGRKKELISHERGPIHRKSLAAWKETENSNK